MSAAVTTFCSAQPPPQPSAGVQSWVLGVSWERMHLGTSKAARQDDKIRFFIYLHAMSDLTWAWHPPGGTGRPQTHW